MAISAGRLTNPALAAVDALDALRALDSMGQADALIDQFRRERAASDPEGARCAECGHQPGGHYTSCTRPAAERRVRALTCHSPADHGAIVCSVATHHDPADPEL